MNTLKIEITIPDWVNWIAVDRNGETWGFEIKPKKNDDWWSASAGKGIELYADLPPKNWEEELYTWG